MNIKRAKEEIKNTIEAYLMKNEYGVYEIPPIRQRPVLLMGPPGIGKTQIMEQISQECRIAVIGLGTIGMFLLMLLSTVIKISSSLK